MWEPFRLSLQQWAPQCKIVYDKFHIMQHANDAVDEVRRAEFFRKSPKMRRSDQRKAVVAVKPLEAPGLEQARCSQSTVPPEPASVQGLHAQREPGKSLELSL
jgi:transposase